MNITIINDCRDDNAKGRQLARINSIFGIPATFVGVRNDIEAAGNIIDIIDAMGNEEGIILANVAPRQKESKKWGNGAPFGYFRHKKTLVLASIEGLTLSLVKKFQLTATIKILDIPKALEVLINKEYLSGDLREHISKTQFRSYDFLPRAAKYIYDNGDIVSTGENIKEIRDSGKVIWWVDNFGNCKTTILAEETEHGAVIKTRFGDLPFHPNLSSVPDDSPAIVMGSSGLGNKRFLELVIQGKNAASHFNLSTGDTII